MKAFVESGLVIDLALVVIALEVVVLLVLRQRTARGLRPLDVLGQLLAGALLLLGIRCAVTGADHVWTLLCLSASFPAHAFDLARRARQQRSTT